MTPWQLAGIVAAVWLVGFLCLAGSGADTGYAALWPAHVLARAFNVGSPGGPFVRNVDM